MPTGAGPVNQFPKNKLSPVKLAGRKLPLTGPPPVGNDADKSAGRTPVNTTGRRAVMSAGDINELTIAGHVEQPPRMSRDEDGQDVCEFLLSHASREHSACEYGQWELEHYAVVIYGRRAKQFVATYQPGELIIITGRLTSQEHAISVWLWKRLGGARRMRPHEYTRIGHRIRVIEPLASIIAHTITTTGSHINHNQAQLPV